MSRVIRSDSRGRDTLRRFLDEIDGQLNGSRKAQPVEIPVRGLKGEVEALIETLSPGKSSDTEPPIMPLPLHSLATADSDDGTAATTQSNPAPLSKSQPGNSMRCSIWSAKWSSRNLWLPGI